MSAIYWPTAAPIFSDFGEETMPGRRNSLWVNNIIITIFSHDHEIVVNFNMVDYWNSDRQPRLEVHSCYRFHYMSLEQPRYIVSPMLLLTFGVLPRGYMLYSSKLVGYASTQLFHKLQKAYASRLCI